MKRWLTYIVPVALGIAVLAFWEWAVVHWQVPRFVLPAPSAIGQSFVDDRAQLAAATWTTFRIVVEAFVLALVSGVALAIVFAQSRIAELALYPYAVILQVTPIVAIAPLIVIWVG
jgi:NitT/TauT family transport system permease protein